MSSRDLGPGGEAVGRTKRHTPLWRSRTPQPRAEHSRAFGRGREQGSVETCLTPCTLQDTDRYDLHPVGHGTAPIYCKKKGTMGIEEPHMEFDFIFDKTKHLGKETPLALTADSMLSKLNKQDTKEGNCQTVPRQGRLFLPDMCQGQPTGGPPDTPAPAPALRKPTGVGMFQEISPEFSQRKYDLVIMTLDTEQEGHLEIDLYQGQEGSSTGSHQQTTVSLSNKCTSRTGMVMTLEVVVVTNCDSWYTTDTK
ncbi:hypothetical protein STEG23_030245 [Scotinomys teguina]